MLNFKTIEILEPNTEILENIKSYSYKTKKGRIKQLLKQIYSLLNQHNT